MTHSLTYNTACSVCLSCTLVAGVHYICEWEFEQVRIGTPATAAATTGYEQ